MLACSRGGSPASRFPGEVLGLKDTQGHRQGSKSRCWHQQARPGHAWRHQEGRQGRSQGLGPAASLVPWGGLGLSESPAGCCSRREGLALGGPGTALGPGAGQDGLGPQLGTQGAAGWVVRRLVLAGLWGGWGWAGRRGGRLTAPTQLSVRSELRP